MKKINGNKVIEIGQTMGLRTFENEFAFYVKVTEDEYTNIANNDIGLYNTLSLLDIAESNDDYDILVWQEKMKKLELNETVVGIEAKEFYVNIQKTGDMFSEVNCYDDRTKKQSIANCESGDYLVTFHLNTDEAYEVKRIK